SLRMTEEEAGGRHTPGGSPRPRGSAPRSLPPARTPRAPGPDGPGGDTGLPGRRRAARHTPAGGTREREGTPRRNPRLQPAPASVEPLGEHPRELREPEREPRHRGGRLPGRDGGGTGR